MQCRDESAFMHTITIMYARTDPRMTVDTCTSLTGIASYVTITLMLSLSSPFQTELLEVSRMTTPELQTWESHRGCRRTVVSGRIFVISPMSIALDRQRLLDNSRIRQLADWTTRGLDISRTGQLADLTSRGLDNWRMPPATLRA